MVLVEESDTGVRVQLPLGWNTLLPINFDIENFVLKACEGDHKFFSAEVLLMSVGKGRCGWFYIFNIQIPSNYSLPTPHISTPPIGGAFGIQLNICDGAFLRK